MGLLHCDLRVSWQTQLISGLFYGVVIFAILLIPWPQQDWPIWLILIALITLEAMLSQKRISKTKGTLTLLDEKSVYWEGQEWLMTRSPFMLSFGIFLSLKSGLSGKHKGLWVAADSMAQEQWRGLCHMLKRNKQ